MNKDQIIENAIAYVKATLKDAEGGHDWWHIYRVWKTAKQIAQQETGKAFVVELGALLHDIADSKFHDGDESIGPAKARSFLQSQQVDDATTAHVVNIIENISFKGGKEKQVFKSLELDIVQDADRLDAMGAIGIARAFNYGGFKNRKLYDPEVKPNLMKSKEQYKKNADPTINHFYEKLFLLKDRMNTAAGKQMAAARHEYMNEYVDRFYKEWEGEI
ncbi:MAG: HD domain-containing protein [Chitinophagaceae bacterium]|nr:HD domain-containing protein [Chitinophagaceae bacterium]